MTLTDAPERERDLKGDPVCAVCKLHYASHSGELCRACNAPVEHHDGAGEDECWEGRARMAHAKRAAGLDLNRVDVEALDRVPVPSFLTIGGYR